MRSIILIYFLSIYSIGTYAQSTTFNIRKIDSAISQSLLKNYKPNLDSFNKACIDGLVLIKFMVNNNGKIDQLEFSKGSPPFITEALGKVIMHLEEQKDFIKEMAGTKKIIVKPFWYDYQNGCDYPKPFSNIKGEDFYKQHLRVQADKANYSTTLRYLLTFGANEYNPGIDCILLSPSTMGPVR